MKTILVLFTTVTFTTCQYEIDIESRDSTLTVTPAYDQTIPVQVQYGTTNQETFVKNTNPEITQTYATESPIAKTRGSVSAAPSRRTEKPERKPKRNPDGDAYIVKYSNINNGLEGYMFGYETSNGISRNEQLTFYDIGEDRKAADIRGGYEYVDPFGRRVVVTYTAGRDGFKPIIKYY